MKQKSTKIAHQARTGDNLALTATQLCAQFTNTVLLEDLMQLGANLPLSQRSLSHVAGIKLKINTCSKQIISSLNAFFLLFSPVF